MKLGAFTLLTLSLSLTTTIALLSYAIYSGDRPFAVGALISFAVTLVFFIFYKIFSSSAHCPLCRGPILGGSGAQRNRKARRFFGSHRIRVAFTIFFRNSFVCPYCNEPTRCAAKARPKEESVVRRRSASRR